MYAYTVILLILFSFSDGSVVDILNKNKCSINDNKCLMDLYQVIIKTYAKSGIPEMEIPPFDPLVIKNLNVTILDSVTITIVDGVGKGISGCVFKHLHLDMDKLVASHEVICNVTVKGDIAVSGSNELFQALTGGTKINTYGKVKAKIEKALLKFDIPISIIKKDDGETYLKLDTKSIKINFDIEKIIFAAEKIFIGKDDISQFVVGYLNENWKTLVKNFGHVFIKKAIDVYFVFAENFFLGMPTKNYLIEDLTSFIDN